MNLHAIIPAAGMGQRLGAGALGEPKSLLPVAGTPILQRAISLLAARGITRLTIVLGYRGERIRRCLAPSVRGMDVDYVWNTDFASSEHGYSVYLARRSWERDRLAVLLVDADNIYEPALLDRLLASKAADCVMVDARLDSRGRDEELVLGHEGRVTGFVRGRGVDFAECVGSFVGMNRFSAGYMQHLFTFMEQLFAVHGRGFKYERVFHRLLTQSAPVPDYLDSAGIGWVNVNHPEDVARAEALLSR